MVNLTPWDNLFEQYLKSIKLDKSSVFAYEDEVNSIALQSFFPKNCTSVLDLGCGDGRFTKQLSSFFPDVIAIDLSEKMIRKAKQDNPNITFYKYDLEKGLPKFNKKLDVITAKLLLVYIKDINKLVFDSFQTLKSGGVMIVSVTHPNKWVTDEDMNYYKDYPINATIAENNNLLIPFIPRTIETYINTFTKYGFKLDVLLETGVPDVFVIKYPNYIIKQGVPHRLNMRFIKP